MFINVSDGIDVKSSDVRAFLTLPQLQSLKITSLWSFPLLDQTEIYNVSKLDLCIFDSRYQLFFNSLKQFPNLKTLILNVGFDEKQQCWLHH